MQTAALHRSLLGVGTVYFPVTGCNPDLTHLKPAYGCEAGSPDSAITWSDPYRQFATRYTGSIITLRRWCTPRPADATCWQAGRPG